MIWVVEVRPADDNQPHIIYQEEAPSAGAALIQVAEKRSAGREPVNLALRLCLDCGQEVFQLDPGGSWYHRESGRRGGREPFPHHARTYAGPSPGPADYDSCAACGRPGPHSHEGPDPRPGGGDWR